jgi:hypothetical protein
MRYRYSSPAGPSSTEKGSSIAPTVVAAVAVAETAPAVVGGAVVAAVAGVAVVVAAAIFTCLWQPINIATSFSLMIRIAGDKDKDNGVVGVLCTVVVLADVIPVAAAELFTVPNSSLAPVMMMIITISKDY